jgi:hypothetical protein
MFTSVSGARVGNPSEPRYVDRNAKVRRSDASSVRTSRSAYSRHAGSGTKRVCAWATINIHEGSIAGSPPRGRHRSQERRRQ